MAVLTVNIDPPPIPTGNTLWVDAVNGDDATGTAGRQDLPYLTLTAAKAEATSGDLIHVRPGTYDEKNLLKNGVNWYFEPGASVVYTGATDGSIFDDSVDGANGAVSCIIDGEGVFTWTNDYVAAAQDYGVVHIVNPASVVVINGRSINQLGDNFQYGWTVLQEDGLLTVNISDTINSPNGAYSLGWYGGTAHINAPQITGGQVTWAGTSVGGNWYINCDLLEPSATDIAIYAETADTVGALWINTLLFKGAASTGLVSGISGKVYITAQKIWNTDASGPVINAGGQTLWLTAQKMTAASGAFFRCEGSASVVIMEVQQYESTLVGAAASGSIFNESADLTIIGGVLAITNTGETQVGIQHVDGVTRVSGMTLDLSGNDQTDSYPIVVGAAGLILEGCTIVAPTGASSITAAAAQTVIARGANTIYQAVDANVAVEGNMQLDNGASTFGHVPIANADGTWSWGDAVVQVTGLTLLDTGWTLVGGLYEYDLADANILATSIVEVIPDNADAAIVQAAVFLPRTDSSAGSVKVYATNEPTDDIGVTINIYNQ